MFLTNLKENCEYSISSRLDDTRVKETSRNCILFGSTILVKVDNEIRWIIYLATKLDWKSVKIFHMGRIEILDIEPWKSSHKFFFINPYKKGSIKISWHLIFEPSTATRHRKHKKCWWFGTWTHKTKLVMFIHTFQTHKRFYFIIFSFFTQNKN